MEEAFAAKNGLRASSWLRGGVGGVTDRTGWQSSSTSPLLVAAMSAAERSNEEGKGQEQSKSPLVHFVSGGLGSVVGTLVTCPLEVIKTRMQSSPDAHGKRDGVLASRRSTLLHVVDNLRFVITNEGIRGLYKGAWPHLVGAVPSRAVYLALYTRLKTAMVDDVGLDPLSPAVALGSAASASFVTTTLNNPIWVVKTRMQLQTGVGQPLRYANAVDCFVQTFRHEGIRGLYKGVTAGYAGISESVLYWMLYEQAKLRVSAERGEEQLHPFILFIMAAGCKSIATTITYPHEVVRTRMREPPGSNRPSRGRHFFQIVYNIAKHEGRAGLYAGMTPHLMRVIPNTAIMMASYEIAVRVLGDAMEASSSG